MASGLAWGSRCRRSSGFSHCTPRFSWDCHWKDWARSSASGWVRAIRRMPVCWNSGFMPASASSAAHWGNSWRLRMPIWNSGGLSGGMCHRGAMMPAVAPEAPLPKRPRSIRAMDAPLWARRQAMAQPMTPPPMMARSTGGGIGALLRGLGGGWVAARWGCWGGNFFYFRCIWLHLDVFFRGLALGVGLGMLLFGVKYKGFCHFSATFCHFCRILSHF